MEILLASCTLRSWRLDDQASLARHARSDRIWRNLKDRFPRHYTLDDARRWLQAAVNQDPERALAIEVEGQAVGGIGIEPGTDVYRRSAEIGYWLGEDFWGRGIATEAVAAFTAYCFRQLGFERIHAGVFGWNRASIRVLEKCGYRLEGRRRNAVFKDGMLTDELLYAILRAEEGAPRPVRSPRQGR